jgi:hypothetical protein
MFIWTDQTIAECARRWAAGEGATAIALAIGAPSRNAIVGKMQRCGVTSGNPAPKRTRRDNCVWTNERIAQLRELHAAGKPYRAIALKLGVTVRAISGAASRYGLKFYEPRPPQRKAETIKAARRVGFSYTETARIAGVSRNAVSGIAFRERRMPVVNNRTQPPGEWREPWHPARDPRPAILCRGAR